MPKHSKIACSSMQRLVQCTGSLHLPNHPMPDNEYTLEGTRMHDVAERGLTVGRDNVKHLCTEEEFEHLEMYWNRIEMLERYESRSKSGEDRTRLVEHRMHSKTIDDFGGTADYGLVVANKGWIVDLKWGKGQYVSVVGNQQLIAYAALLLEQYPNLNSVTVWIVQPRMDNMDSVTYDAATLREWLEDVKVKVESEFVELSAGSHCGWCPAITSCPLVEKEVHSIEQTDDLKRKVDSYKRVAKYAKEVPRIATEHLEAGGTIEGYKLVAKEGREKYVNEDRLIQNARRYGILHEISETKLKTPAQLRKLGYEWLLDGETERPVTGTMAVPETDSREEVTPIIEFEKGN